MNQQPGLPIRAEHVGSLIRPEEIVKARKAAQDTGDIETRQQLATLQQGAIREIVSMQQDLGFRVVTDGEYNRTSWQRDFLLKIDNVAEAPSKLPVRFHSDEGVRDHKPPTMQVLGKLARPSDGMFVSDYVALHTIANTIGKVTMPSPSVLHFRGGREMIDRNAYPAIDQFYADLGRIYQEEIADLAAAGCRYVQLDEVNLAYLCDPKLRQHAAQIGEDPDALLETYAALINRAIALRPDNMTAAMHLCRGNFAGHWIAEGGYEPVAEVVLNTINVDRYFLEYDSERAGGFEPLRFLPSGKIIVLGLVTTKSPVLESKDDLKRRIDEAAKVVPIDQLALSPQCGFASGIGGETMTMDEQKRKLALVVETAVEVWGNA